MAYFIHLTKEQKGILKPKRTKCPWEPGVVLHEREREREREVCDQHGLAHVCVRVFLAGPRQRSDEEECVKWCFYK